MVWPVTAVNPLTTGALPKLIFGAVIWQSLVTVMLTVRLAVPLPVSRPRQMPPTPIPEQ